MDGSVVESTVADMDCVLVDGVPEYARMGYRLHYCLSFLDFHQHGGFEDWNGGVEWFQVCRYYSLLRKCALT